VARGRTSNMSKSLLSSFSEPRQTKLFESSRSRAFRLPTVLFPPGSLAVGTPTSPSPGGKTSRRKTKIASAGKSKQLISCPRHHRLSDGNHIYLRLRGARYAMLAVMIFVQYRVGSRENNSTNFEYFLGRLVVLHRFFLLWLITQGVALCRWL
jgi:hypothetical protein